VPTTATTDAPSELLRWYDRHRRDLPWRATRDPYAVWLSEVMSQQTRVDVVVPYWHRFLERFPTVADLAAAPLDDVLALWSGLGYYRRARQLHRAAQAVAAAGAFPGTAEGLRELPGIGPYTAAAVASIAFGEAVPVMDGNVERVTARLGAVAGDPKRSANRRRLLAIAASLLDPERPGDSNQALMELGATVCTPRNPSCLLCPLSEGCAARGEGDPEAYPPPRKRRAPMREVRLVALVADDRGRHLYFRRSDDEKLLAGIWELPWTQVETAPGTRPSPGVLARATVALGERYGGVWSLGEHLGAARHGITHRAIELEVVAAGVTSGGVVAEGPEAGWLAPRDLDGVGVSSMVAKILEVAGLPV
jgi:A/G-specific adenine glycosylase